MAWTQEDVKDVMKKAVGTMIAVAIISLGTAIYSRRDPLIFAIIMSLAAAVIVIIIILQPRLKRTTSSPQQQLSRPADLPSAPPAQDKAVGSEPAKQDAEVASIIAAALEAKRIEMEYKLRKKALKAEKKAQKNQKRKMRNRKMF